MLDDLIIFQKIYDFLLWLYPIVNKFPKSQRFVLGQQIENSVLEMIKVIIRANQVIDKKNYLEEASIKLDVSRILMRLAKDLRFISIKQYETAAEKINEIGRLLSGLKKRFS
jgi:four helix bundle protein